MKREIKFRHFDPNYKAMTPFDEIRILPSDKKFCHLFNPDSDGGFLMQYTGIKDKNGVEIYEGDILNITNPDFKYFIVFENCAFLAYHLTLKDFDGTHLRWGLLSRFGELNIEIEIIGNIHQNPELL